MKKGLKSWYFVILVGFLSLINTGFSIAQDNKSYKINKVNPSAQRIIEHWTPERRQQAIPKDLVIDSQGAGFLRKPNGDLQAYGKKIPLDTQTDNIKVPRRPSGNDNVGPEISNFSPYDGETIGTTHTFSVKVLDSSGVKFVKFTFTYPDGVSTTTLNARKSGDIWSITLNISEGNWQWYVEAKDKATKGGNTTVTSAKSFIVGVITPTNPPITNSAWDEPASIVQKAAGRIYFEMPNEIGGWSAYVCSGTVATDGTANRSIIITAAHCVYDDVYKKFARNVMFIPDQSSTSALGTDLNCNNDPYGCWVPSFGVVDNNWALRTFPDNIAWDYAYYVVDDNGAHQGNGTEQILDNLASLPIDFAAPVFDTSDDSDYSYALGYSYSEDPKFMYCAEDMTTEGLVNWWIPSCELSGGSSGGPWVQAMTVDGTGLIVSVNSWGYVSSPGMAGPVLDSNESSAQCLFNQARQNIFINSAVDGDAGYVIDGAVCP
ncbi:MAG: hypothetical protein KAT04_13615 [Methylococcales bacterium]|nr:hypothetical protein [Methylococcales bacterium]